MMKKRACFIAFSALLFLLPSFLKGQPCAVPPFLARSLTPNVLIIFDNSGSMLARPFGPYSASYIDTFHSENQYYGYFDDHSKYSYNPGYRYFYEDPDGDWDGNFLNWAAMTRIDVARKVLTGGKWYVERNDTLLVLNYDARHYLNKKVVLQADEYTPFKGKVYLMRRRGPLLRFYKNGFTRLIGSFKLRIKISEIPQGVIQKTANQVRYGLMFFNYSEGGYVASYIRYSDEQEGTETHIEKLIEKLNYSLCDVGIGDTAIYTTWTPHAESYYEAMRYYRQENPYYWPSDYALADESHPWRDPWYDSEARDVIWCRKSFVIMVTDGEPTKDRNIPSFLQDYDNDGNDPIPPDQFQGDYPWREGGSDYLDDVAYWSHINDMRSDLQGDQKITFYVIKAFGIPSVKTTWDAAINGGFIDRNDNDIPDDSLEWDADQDGVPDTYFEPARGEELEAYLYRTLASILKRVSSSSAVSIVSSASKGQGTVYQAFFLPSKLYGDQEILWMGYLHSLWIDQWGNLREDSDQNGILTLTQDKILQIVFDTVSFETKVKRYQDPEGDGYYDEDDFVDEVALDEVNSLWNSGEWLHQVSSDDRVIYSFIDYNGDGEVGDGELKEFMPEEESEFYPYLDVSSESEADDVIRFLRGEQIPGMRNRDIDNSVWKLGDIVYSTPTLVGAPMERYDLIYKDGTYRDFYAATKDREPVIYVGANDGVLHTFNAGKFVEGDRPETDDRDEGWIDDGGHDLGGELWAYVPFNLLPQLKWLTDPEYCHVYYVDLKVKATDARIFDEDQEHPKGWGTLLLVGMRFGGTPEYVNGDTLRSAYVAIDVTDPMDPHPMWEFTDPDLGYTVAYPTVVKIENSWYAIFSSGPVTLDGLPREYGNGYLFVVDLKTGEKLAEIPIGVEEESGVALSNPIGVDVDIDYSVDVIYVGTYYEDNGWKGKVYRIQTHENPNPSTWNVSPLIEAPGPVTAAPTSFMDGWGNLWVTFGTGRYFSESDKWDESAQSFIAVRDPNWNTGCQEINLDDLLDVTNVHVVSTDTGVVVTGLDNVSTFDELVEEAYNHPGWRVNFTGGERVLNKALVLGGAVLFPTFMPTQDPCGFGGFSKLYAIFYETGTAFNEPLLGEEPNGEYKTSVDLGEGLPSQPNLFVGKGGEKGFVQVSTGAISEIKIQLPYSPRSRIVLWKGK